MLIFLYSNCLQWGCDATRQSVSILVIDRSTHEDVYTWIKVRITFRSHIFNPLQFLPASAIRIKFRKLPLPLLPFFCTVCLCCCLFCNIKERQGSCHLQKSEKSLYVKWVGTNPAITGNNAEQYTLSTTTLNDSVFLVTAGGDVVDAITNLHYW